MRLHGKTALITGAARGIGLAFARAYAAEGATVCIADLNLDAAQKAAAEIGPQAHAIALDVTRQDSIDAAFAAAIAQMGYLDILINNAAQWLPGRMDEHDAYAISQTITGIVTGTLLFTRGLVPLLEKSGAGDILNIVSISGIANTPLLGASVAYYAAKHGQAGMNDGLRQELKGRPVRVSAIFPSYIKDISPLNEAEWNAIPASTSWATNRDIVEAALFAISRPRHVTLASIIVDPDQGGLH